MRNHPVWLDGGSMKGPVCVVCHRANSSVARVALHSAASKVSVELTRNDRKVREWSLRFCPTEGRLCIGLTPTEFRVEELPMPECGSIFGVPNVPAERIISSLAVKLNRWPEAT
jgi:hypothetical protein